MFGRLRGASKLSLIKIGLAAFSLITLIFFLYFWRVGTLTRGFSPSEVLAQKSSLSFQAIMDNPLYAPHKVLSYSVQKVLGQGAPSVRAISGGLAVLFLFSFYHLTRGWFGKMVGFFATLLLAATPWVILLARSATPTILLLTPLILITCYYWLTRSRGAMSFSALMISGALNLYVPGMVWLVLLGLFVSRKNWSSLLDDINRLTKLAAFGFCALLISPLIYASVKNPHVIASLFLIPVDWSPLLTTLKSIAWSVLATTWRTPTHTDFIIGRLPMLNAAQIALGLFGGFALWKLARNKLYILIGLAVFGTAAAGINRDLSFLTLSLPALAVTIAAGLRYLYMEWKSVFPKNPIPKYLAFSLITVLAALQVVYGVRYSLIAWPNTPATRSTYVLK